MDAICDTLFEREKIYFNPQKISKQQVLELIQKLYVHIYGSNKENQAANRKENNNISNESSKEQIASSKDKNKVATSVLSTTNNQKAKVEEEDDDDYENDPWDFDDKKPQ